MSQEADGYRFKDTCDGAFKHQCTRCLKWFPQSDTWIWNAQPALDWQGTLSLTCYRCSPDWLQDEPIFDSDVSTRATATSLAELRPTVVPDVSSYKHFKSSCKLRWANRGIQAGEFSRRARATTWKGLVATFKDKYPDASRDQLRDLAARACGELALQHARLFHAVAPAQQARLTQAFDEWTRSWAQRAEDPSWIPPMPQEAQVTSMCLDYFSALNAGVDEYFVCRRPECLFLGRNTDWIEKTTRGAFRCPMCAQRYHPWRQQPGYIPYQKVLVFSAFTGRRVGCPQSFLPSP